jgi:hypothetical protein
MVPKHLIDWRVKVADSNGVDVTPAFESGGCVEVNVADTRSESGGCRGVNVAVAVTSSTTSRITSTSEATAELTQASDSAAVAEDEWIDVSVEKEPKPHIDDAERKREVCSVLQEALAKGL